MTMLTYKEVMERVREDTEYRKWERERKNFILGLSNYQRKRALWKETFPVMELSDEWLKEAEVF